jgi:hypothetical protein
VKVKGVPAAGVIVIVAERLLVEGFEEAAQFMVASAVPEDAVEMVSHWALLDTVH